MAVQTNNRFNFSFKRPGINPILIKELRSRMRGPRAFLILTGFLLLLSGISFLLYEVMEESLRYGPGPMSTSAVVGATMFLGIAFFELFLVAFITPALTAGTISGERESLTYEMLVATPLRPSSIIFGKMGAALSYVFLLILAAVPMLSLVFIFGGVTLRDMAVALLVLVVSAITFGTVGLFWSALLGRTGRATVASYLTLLLFIMGPIMASVTWGILKRQIPPPGLLYPSPFVAMTSVLNLNPDQIWGFGPLSFFLGGGMGMIMGGPMPTPLNHPAWHWTLSLYTILAVVLMLATIILVRPIGRRRVTIPQGLFALLLVGALLGGMSLIFSGEDWGQIWQSPEEFFKGNIAPPAPAPLPPPPAAERDGTLRPELPIDVL